MLVRKVPEIGTGLGAGIPEYPWWFGTDNSYALFGALVLGQFEVVKDTLRLLKKISEEKNNRNGRVIHEASSNGVVSNPGNTQETPHFVKCVYYTYLWTGDIHFLKEMYPFCKKGVLNWLLGEMDSDGDLFPSGYGIIEIEDLNLEMIDTAVYTYEALQVLGCMAKILGEEKVVQKTEVLSEQLEYQKTEKEYIFVICSKQDGWYIKLDLPRDKKVIIKRYIETL
jgi:glycogen debranching enzyme